MVGPVLYLSDTKRALLHLMKRRGVITVDDAVEATGLTKASLREHLTRLERDGLVEHDSKRNGRGRPTLLYRLSSMGERLFPSFDGVLLGRLLDFLDKEGQRHWIDSFFTRFWQDRTDDVKSRLDAVSLDDRNARLTALKQILSEQGFMPEIEILDDGLVIRECNCPFPEAVRHTRIPCRLEAEFFAHLLGAPISRVSYIPEGHPACTYEFEGE
jgi:predicted ArsR family transcriptional regulator